jgi:hypothetical protein
VFLEPDRARPTRAPRWAYIGTLAAVAILRAPVSAQQPPAGVTLSGVVLDAGSGAPVGGAFLQVGERGPRAIADSIGRFRIPNVPSGEQRLSVQRFGYARQELAIRVGAAPAPLEIRLAIDPVQVQGLTVTGRAEVSVSGVVRDATSGATLPNARLRLTPDAVRATAEDVSDREGVFHLSDVPTGAYLLRVELLGYQSRYAQVAVAAPSDPLELRLEPDSVMMRGVVQFNRQLRGRRNAFLGIASAYDERRLLESGSPDAVHFLEHHTWVSQQPCDDRKMSSVCVLGRGGSVVEAKVFVDELPVMGFDQLEVLRSYRPEDFYLVEVFGFNVIHVYTHAYAERQARRPRLMLPPG